MTPQGNWAARLVSVLLLIFLSAPVCGEEITFSKATIQIESGGRLIPLDVELALTQSQQAKGLMYRQELPAGQGMLFDFGSEKPILMWMKNTLIPLDMIFINKRGEILAIRANAVPHSEKIISIGRPARAVLEIAGGQAAKLGLRVGDKIQYPAFKE